MPIEGGGRFILRIHDDPRHRQHRAGLHYLPAGVGKQDRALTLSLKILVGRKPPDSRYRYRIAGKFARQRFRQFGAIDAARAQREEAGKPPGIFFRRGNKKPHHITPHILRGIAADMFVEWILSAAKSSRVNGRIERPDSVARHRRTCLA